MMKKLVISLLLLVAFLGLKAQDQEVNTLTVRDAILQYKNGSLDSLIVPQTDGTAKYKNGADPVSDLDLANKRYVDGAGGWDSIVFNPNTGYASWYLDGVKLDSTFWDGRYVKYSDSTIVFVTPPQLSDSLATIQESPFDSILLVGADILTTDPAPYVGETWYGLDVQRALASDGSNWFFVKLKSINSGFGGFGNPADNVTNNTTQIVIPDDGLFIFATTNGVGSGVKFSIVSAAGETILITDPRITALTGGIGVGDIIRINCHYDQSLGYQFTDDKLNVDVSGKIHMFDIAVGDLGGGVQFIDQSAIMFPFVIQSTQEDRHNLYSTQTEGLSVLLASVASGDYTLEIPTYIVKQEGINFQAYFNSNRQTVTRETTTEKQTVLVVYPDGSVANIAGQTIIDGNVYWNNLTESLTAVANNSWSTQLVYVDKFYSPFSGGVTNGIVYVIPWQAEGINQGYGDLNSAINDLQSYIDRHTPVENAALSYYVILKKNTSDPLEVVIGSLIGGGQGGGSSVTTSLDKITNATNSVTLTAGATNLTIKGSGTTTDRSLTFQDQDGIVALQAIDPLVSGGVVFADGAGKMDNDGANLFWDDINKYLGIGTNTPSTELDVIGKGTFNEIDLPLLTNGGVLYYDALNDKISQNTGVLFYDETNDRLEITSTTNDQLHLRYSPVFYTKFFTNASGNLEISPTGTSVFTDGHVWPKVTDTYDLGSMLFRWDNLYVDNIESPSLVNTKTTLSNVTGGQTIVVPADAVLNGLNLNWVSGTTVTVDIGATVSGNEFYDNIILTSSSSFRGFDIPYGSNISKTLYLTISGGNIDVSAILKQF